MALANTEPKTPAQIEAENRDLRALQQASFDSTSVTVPTTLQEIVNIAKVMAGSGFYPDAKTAMQAAALMIMGQQFGLSPAQALTGIHIVKGKPMLHYSVILAKVRQHPHYDYRIVEHTEKVCRIEFIHNGSPCGESVFTVEDAKRQGTQNMDKHGKTMLLARAASNGVKWYCPDVLNGMPVYVQGEIPEDAVGDVGISKRDQIWADLEARAAVGDDPPTESAQPIDATVVGDDEGSFDDGGQGALV